MHHESMQMRHDYKNNRHPGRRFRLLRTMAPDPMVESHRGPLSVAVGGYVYNPGGSAMSKRGHWPGTGSYLRQRWREYLWGLGTQHAEWPVRSLMGVEGHTHALTPRPSSRWEMNPTIRHDAGF